MLGFDDFVTGAVKKGEVWKLGSTCLLPSALDGDVNDAGFLDDADS